MREHCCFDDGKNVSAGTLNDSVWIVFCGHPVMRTYLFGHDLGGQNRTAVEWLILDRSTRTFLVTDRRVALDLLADASPQEAPPPDMTAEDIARVFQSMKPSQPETQSLEEKISQKIKRDAKCIADMKNWLDSLLNEPE